MSKMSWYFICAVAVFILISDQIKVVPAKTLERRAVATYTARFDNIDVDRIVQSRRLVTSYVNCLLDKGPCTPEGKELKKYLPEAIATQCAKCTDIQKKQAGKVFTHLLQNYRDFWDQLLDKYDSNGEFRKQYEIDEDDYDDYEDEKQV